MSKEKQCKCCKEYWWEMNIHSQSGLCPNCYDYVADLEAKLAESQHESQEFISKYRYWRGECAELNKQLAEKDKAIENWQTMYQSVMQSCHNGIEEDKRLREQLAEKEKEIERWKEQYFTEIGALSYAFNQAFVLDKISFAVEQLTHFEQEVLNYVDKVYGGIEDILDKEDLDYILDNQIKKIKGNKDE